MASYKQRKITRIVREFSKNGDSYDITGINLGLAKYFYRESQELFQNLTVGDYRIDQSNGKQTLIITNQILLGQLETIQIGYVLDFGASKYETEWNVDINTLKDKYNQLVETCDNLWEYIRQTGFISDDTTMDLILPQLNINEVWIWTKKGYMGMPIDDVQESIKDAIQNYLTTMVYPAIDDYIERVIKPRIDLYVENNSKPKINAFTEVKKTELKDLKDILATQLQELVDNALADRGIIPNNTDWHNLNYGTWYVADLNGSGYINQPTLDNDEGMGVVIVTDSQGGRSKVVRYYSIKKRMHFTIKTINGVWSEWGTLSDGSGIRYEYTQPNHGFLFTPVMLDGVTNSWVKATKAYGADGIAIYKDTNKFELVLNGGVLLPLSAKDSKNNAFVADEFYFLSDTVAGGLDKDKPQEIFQSLIRTYLDEQGRMWAEVEVDTPVDLEPRVLIDDVNSLDIMTSNRVVLRENTIADLMASRRYKLGDVVEVLGYYSSGDGANHKRIASSADDGSGVQLANGLWANIVHNGKVDVSWFGARGNGIISGIELLGEDDSTFLNKAIIFCKNTSATLSGDKNYRLDEQIIIYCDFYFPDSTFYTNVNLQKHAIILDSKGNNFTIDKVISSGDSHLTSKNWDKENYAIGIGFSAGNFYNKNVTINEIFYHNRGLDITPSKGNFVGYNRFKILSIIDCGWGININPVTAGDWVNQNEFYVNRVRHNSSSAGNKATRIRVVKEDGLGSTPNENMFINTCLEGNHGIVVYSKNSHSKFLNIRLEAIPEKSMIFDGEISNYTVSNSIVGASGFGINKLDLRRNALMPYVVSDFNIYMKQMLEVSTPLTNSPIAILKNSNGKDFLKIYGDKMYLCDQTSGIEKIVFRANLGGNAFIDFTNGSTIRRYSEAQTRLEKFNLYNSYINSGYNVPQTTKNGELFLDLKGRLKVFNGEWKEIVLSNPIQTLNTPYHTEKMKNEGVYNDFIVYMDQKTAYDNQQREKEKAMQLAYEEALKENPELTYEEFISTRPTTFRHKRSLEIQEPVPSQALLEFKEKYIG